jgi:hypothetical protein
MGRTLRALIRREKVEWYAYLVGRYNGMKQYDLLTA